METFLNPDDIWALSFTIAIVLIVTFIQEETGTILILICHQNYLRTI